VKATTEAGEDLAIITSIVDVGGEMKVRVLTYTPQ
jgi:hypothetical protein